MPLADVRARAGRGALALRTLGPRWAIYRARHAAQLRLGVMERRSPRTSWAAVPMVDFDPPGIVDRARLAQLLVDGLTDIQRAELLDRNRRLQSFEFDVFGRWISPTSWHHDPIAGVEYDADAHWSRVGEFPDADLKYVWEPSRFGWAYDLVRLHLIDPTAGAAETFWRLFGSWCDQNPPNTGVQWGCGQETAIRLMAVTIAVDAMRETLDESRRSLVGRFGYASGQRIAANLDYARSQNNNHYSSEAAGLLTASVLYGTGEQAVEWRRTALTAFDDIDRRLIFDDGGSSQYSTNYHRVFVHGLCWAVLMIRVGDIDAPSLTRSTQRAAGFLAQLPEATSGFGPRFGHDDGADILPLAFGAAHRDLRPTIALCDSLGITSGERDPDGEAASWFGHGSDDRTPTGPGRTPTVPDRPIFSDAGLAILRNGGTTVYLRATMHRFRPGHCDQLSVEVWHAGRCIIDDPGTLSYKAAGTDGASSILHSTITVDDEEHMTRVGRFLWADWTKASFKASDHERTVGAEHQLRNQGAKHERTVTVADDGGVTVTDVVTCDAPARATQSWCLGTELHVAGSVTLSQLEVGDGYGRPTARTFARFTSGRSNAHRFRTQIDPAQGTLETVVEHGPSTADGSG